MRPLVTDSSGAELFELEPAPLGKALERAPALERAEGSDR
jgi:hypothetical protein